MKGVNDMNYSFTQNVTKDDYVAFVTNHIFLSFLRPFNLVLFVISVGYLLATPFLTGGDFTFFFVGLGIFVFIFLLAMFVRRNAKKTYDRNPDGFTMTYEVDDQSLKYMTREGELVKNWPEFYRVKETNDYLFVYINQHSGLVLVKREIPSDAYRFILQQLEQHVIAKRLKLLKK